VARGFILQPTYRIESGRAVVHIYGKLEGGKSFLVRDTRQVPCFYVRGADSERALRLGAAVQDVNPPRVTMQGEAAARVVVQIPQHAPPLRNQLTAEGIPTFEADVLYAYRYLIERGVRASIEISGASHPGEGIDAVFENPEINPAEWDAELTALSIDIETDPQASRLLSIALDGCGAAEVILLGQRGAALPPKAIRAASERELLQVFVRRVRELDPDILTGWNVVDFDLTVLSQISDRTGIQLALGRGPGSMQLRRSRSPMSTSVAQVPGRLVIDGIDLVRGAFIRFENYSLDSVARAVLGEGKTMTGDGRAHEIMEAFERDRERFVEYNLNDARLVTEILRKLHLLELAVERSRLTGMPPDRVAASIASFDFLYLSELSRRGIVAPTVENARRGGEPLSGGHVLEPLPGLYRNVLVFDFKSLYPSLIRTFQIDPLGYLPCPRPEDDPICAPNGAAFRREQGILPKLLDALFPRREAAKAAGDTVASQAIKILMNSFYGVLGTPACRFASPALANAITGFGREILLWSKACIEKRGYRVVYGDTDSLFVVSGEVEESAALALGSRLVADVNSELAGHIGRKWRVESRLELEFERLYLRLLLPAVRHGTAGARKRYAGLIREKGENRVAFTGMEAVRSDWTELARRVQRELYERLFTDRPVDSYLRQIVRDLRAGKLDSLLLYRKSLRKELDAYTASTPPHVAAARKMSAPPGPVISYLITRNGPEPVPGGHSSPDYEHYVHKQVRAIAEPVLSLLGLEFDDVTGDNTQMRLF